MFREEGIRRVWEPGANLLNQDLFSTLIFESSHEPDQILRRPNPPENTKTPQNYHENTQNEDDEESPLQIFPELSEESESDLNMTIHSIDNLRKRHSVKPLANLTEEFVNKVLEAHADKEGLEEEEEEKKLADEDEYSTAKREDDKNEEEEKHEDKKLVLILTCTGLLAVCLLSLVVCFSHRVI